MRVAVAAVGVFVMGTVMVMVMMAVPFQGAAKHPYRESLVLRRIWWELRTLGTASLTYEGDIRVLFMFT